MKLHLRASCTAKCARRRYASTRRWSKNANAAFVAETKHTGGGRVEMELLRPLEQLKIECGKRHFTPFEQVQFKVVNRLQELVNPL